MKPGLTKKRDIADLLEECVLSWDSVCDVLHFSESSFTGSKQYSMQSKTLCFQVNLKTLSATLLVLLHTLGMP